MFSLEFAIFIAWALAVVISDCRRRLIPNSLVATGAACAFVLAAFRIGPFDTTLPAALTGASAGALALLPFWRFGVMGAGDVKLFAALGAWCGPRALVSIWVAANLAAFAHALVLLARRSSAPAMTTATLQTGSPYGAMLALAAIAQLLLQLNAFAHWMPHVPEIRP
jgi:prepilin peptidase CpaA